MSYFYRANLIFPKHFKIFFKVIEDAKKIPLDNSLLQTFLKKIKSGIFVKNVKF